MWQSVLVPARLVVSLFHGTVLIIEDVQLRIWKDDNQWREVRNYLSRLLNVDTFYCIQSTFLTANKIRLIGLYADGCNISIHSFFDILPYSVSVRGFQWSYWVLSLLRCRLYTYIFTTLIHSVFFFIKWCEHPRTCNLF